VKGTTQYDCLIVGQGIAGSVLALQLMKHGKRVLVVGDERNVSTRVAAGLFNPVTGKVLSKTWRAEEIFKLLHVFYSEEEVTLRSSFYHPKPMYRPFLTIEEQNEWMGKSADPSWSFFIKEIFTHSAGIDHVKDERGGLMLQQTGYLDTVAFMEATREFLIRNHAFLPGSLVYEKLDIQAEEISYDTVTCRDVIFCEGVHALQNPFFGWLPLKPLKGETLTVESQLPHACIINRGVYAVPQGKNLFKIGATYENKDLSPHVTLKGRAELEEGLKDIFSGTFAVVDQQWGLRPTTPDRRPMIGNHPVHRSVWVCNGLGTKGVSLAPYVTALLTENLVYGRQSPAYAEVDVNRYYSLYWKVVQNT
jgi:glycine/D-amino acid oxidase-like deaminating enzyme